MKSTIQKEFEKAYDLYADALYRYCYFRIFNKERSEELVHDIFTQTWHYLVRGNVIDDFKPFLYKVARNLIINEITRRKQHDSLDAMHEETGFEIEDLKNSNTEEASEGRRIIEFLSTLDEESKELLTLRYIDDLPIKKIAEMLDVSTNNATVRLHRATKKLKELYNK